MKQIMKTILGVGFLAGALTALTLPTQAALVAQFKLDEGAIDPTTNTTWSADGVYSGAFTGVVPLWLTNTSDLSPLLLAQTNTVAAITNSASVGYVLTTFYGTNASGNSVLGTNARTVCAWVRTASLPTAANSGYILTYGSVSSSVGGRFTMRLDLTAGYVGLLRCEVSTGSVTATNTPICDGKWHHLAIVSPAGGRVTNLVLYVDGNVQQLGNIGTPGTLINTIPNNPVYIGMYPPLNATGTFIGSIDDVQFYDQVLTAAQIAALVYGPGNPPGITQQPSPQSVNLGSTNASATFTVGVSGSPTMLFQWKKNGVNLIGATNQTLTISPVKVADLASYGVGITNNYGGTNSAAAALTWSTPAVDPLEETTMVGGSATFGITMPADSTGYSYQWQRAGVPIGGGTSSSYTLAAAMLGDASSYGVAVSLSGQSATSAPAALHVVIPPSSPYAQFVLADGPSAYWRLGEANGAAVATDMTAFHNGAYSNYGGFELQQPGALTGDANTASSFTGANWVEVPYTSPALQHNASFTLEAWVNPSAASGVQAIICSRNQFFSSGYELAINGTTWRFRTGNSTSSASEIWTDLSAGTVTAGVWQHVVATFDGTTKRLYVNGVLVGSQVTTVLPTPVPLRLGAGLTYQSNPGNFFTGTIDEAAVYWKALTPSQVSDHYLMGLVGPGVAASITTQPQSQQVILGDTNTSAIFSVGAYGTPRFSYQWKRGGLDLSGQTNATLTIPSAGTAGQAIYSVGVTNGISGVLSSNAALTYITAPITPSALALLAGGSGTFSVSMPSYQPYTYQWKHAGTNLPGATTPSLLLNNVSAADAGAYSVVVALGATSVESSFANLAIIPLATVSYGQTVSNDNPVAWWRLDDAPGSTTAADVYGVNSGTSYSVDNDVAFGVEGALLGDSSTAAKFTGYSSAAGTPRNGAAKIDVPFNTLLNSPTFSVECWAMVTSGSGTYRSPVTSRGTTAGAVSGYLFYASTADTWQFWLGNGTAFVAAGGPAVQENQWAHLVGTYDGTTLSFYVNGALVASGPVTYMPNAAYPLRIGAGGTESTTGSFFFPGRVDEVAVYANALSAARVQAHYAAAFPANAAPRFTQTPLPRAVLSGDSYTLTAKVQGAPAVSYQWKHAGTNLPGATNASLLLGSVKSSDAGTYQVVATRGTGSASTPPASLTVLRGEAVSASIDGNSAATIATYGGRAGYVNATNWNEIALASVAGSKTGLLNNKGQSIAMTATWAAGNYRSWSGPLSFTGGDVTLLNGFLDSTTTSNITLTISGIPTTYQTGGYSLYLYLGAPYSAAGIVNSYDTFGAVSLGTKTNFYHAIDLSQWDGNYLQATNSNPADMAPANANYAVFTNLNSASVTVNLASHPIMTGPASLSGFQVVANYVSPVPITITQQGTKLVLNWSGDWLLQRKDTLDNTSNWVDLPTATSPYTVPTPLQGQQYYRLHNP